MDLIQNHDFAGKRQMAQHDMAAFEPCHEHLIDCTHYEIGEVAAFAPGEPRGYNRFGHMPVVRVIVVCIAYLTLEAQVRHLVVSEPLIS
ncbi:hypothetical protein DDE84_05975 [Bifidobacterium tibiigranuli]|uniref:Uncharacterized protein n=1 Tax=Bifidobacterium tibiigranuli TaxID=2172043 RepID=A0A5N6S5V7_9BIFI|nr:hypothetical protein [Bifidobacterium tibiigranuli]KAE8128430.1 hypothetical protein DDE84_05975 [Bifidobacterium tibiigranuli]KAE8128554.1 hypothetical protein DDF78_05370 [Bifidobacterium tibiigranuli]